MKLTFHYCPETAQLFTLLDKVTSKGKRIVALWFESDLAVLYTNRTTRLLLSELSKYGLVFLRQVWILDGYNMSTSKVINLAYFLISPGGQKFRFFFSDSAALEILKNAYPDQTVECLMLDFERAELSATRTHSLPQQSKDAFSTGKRH